MNHDNTYDTNEDALGIGEALDMMDAIEDDFCTLLERACVYEVHPRVMQAIKRLGSTLVEHDLMLDLPTVAVDGVSQ